MSEMKQFEVLCAQATGRPYRYLPTHLAGTEPYIESDGRGPRLCTMNGEKQEDLANARLLTLAGNNFESAIEMLQDCARILKNEGHSYHAEVEELLAKIEEESGKL